MASTFLAVSFLVKKPIGRDFEVVDGQQRLTTLTILFSVIRDLTKDPRDAWYNALELCRARLPTRTKASLEALRLMLRQKDQAFFEKAYPEARCNCQITLCQRTCRRSGPHHSKCNYRSGARLKMTWRGEEKRIFLRFLLQNCYLVVVEVPTQPAARRIFTVLNARGMDLSATDILKADLLEGAGASKEKQLSRQWEDIEAALGRDRFSDLFVHIRMIFEREKPRSALERGIP